MLIINVNQILISTIAFHVSLQPSLETLCIQFEVLLKSLVVSGRRVWIWNVWMESCRAGRSSNIICYTYVSNCNWSINILYLIHLGISKNYLNCHPFICYGYTYGFLLGGGPPRSNRIKLQVVNIYILLAHQYIKLQSVNKYTILVDNCIILLHQCIELQSVIKYIILVHQYIKLQLVDFKMICNWYPLTFDHDINVKPTLQRFDKIDRIQCKWWIKTIMCKVQIEMLNLMKTTVHEVHLLF